MVILYDRFNMPEDIFDILFATKQQVIVAKLLIDYMKENQNEITKTEMSMFATLMHNGNYIVKAKTQQFRGKQIKLSYNKRQFYDRIY